MVRGGYAQEETLSVDFESSLSTYTDWTFKNITKTNTITAKTGNYYGNTSGNETAYIQTKNIIEAPGTLKFYISKETKNSTSSQWKIQVSSDAKKWTDIKTLSAVSGITKGVWKEVSQDLSSQKNVYVRVYYDGTAAKRCIDDITLTYTSTTDKTPTTTTFGADVDKQTITITEGETFPTHVATMTTEGVAGTIAYASDNDAVNVDQNGVTSAGTGFGKAKITATFTPTDAETYASSSAYYYIDYKEKTKPATAISFEKQNVTLTTLDYASFTGQTATLKTGETILTNELAYSKEDAAGVITTLNNDGTLVLSGMEGTATVTATFNGSAEYASSAASYTVTVKEAIKDIATLKPLITATKMASAQSFTLKLTDAVVTYVNRNSAYIQDATAGIFVYASNHGLKNNQKINGLVDIKALLYSNLPEISSWALDASAEITDDATFDIETVTIADLNANYSKYESKPVKIAGAIVTSEFVSNKAEISQDGNTYLVYNKGGSGVTLTKNDNIDIIGYPTRFNDEYNLYLWKQSNVKVNSTLVATTLSFDPAIMEYSVDNNNKDAFTAPTATVKDAEGNIVEGAAITYTSSEPGVATVGETDGKVTFVGFGTTVITASYAGDATHMDSKNSYTINYGKIKPTMAWSATEVTVNLGEKFTNAPKLSLTADNVSILEGKTITYTSTDENVAVVDVNGTVDLMDKEGTTTITATFAGDDTYAEASAEYTLTVTDPNKLEVTFDFTKPENYGYGKLESDGASVNIEKGGVINSGIVTITNVNPGSTPTRFWNSKGVIALRLYENAQTTISVPEGYILKKVTSDAKIIGTAATWSSGKVGGSDNEWVATEDVNSVTFTANSTIKMANMTVYYAKVDLPTVTFDEEKDDNLSNYDKKTVNVTMKRTIGTGYLNPVCFPFAMDATQITEVFGEGSKVSAMAEGMPDGNLHFDYVETMEAGKPYLVEPTKASTTVEVKNVTINAKPGYDVAADNDGDLYSFQGVFNPYAFTATDGTELFLGKNNTLYMPQSVGQKMKGFRAYFTTSKANESLKIVVGDQTTTISSLMSGKTMTGKVYNLNGQYVGTSLEGLAKGIYVMNGQKFVVK